MSDNPCVKLFSSWGSSCAFKINSDSMKCLLVYSFMMGLEFCYPQDLSLWNYQNNFKTSVCIFTSALIPDEYDRGFDIPKNQSPGVFYGFSGNVIYNDGYPGFDELAIGQPLDPSLIIIKRDNKFKKGFYPDKVEQSHLNFVHWVSAHAVFRKHIYEH